jgi:glycosyltransferase involved in cell wall biosynthesis
VARIVGSVEPARFERMSARYVFYVIATWSTRKAMSDTISAFLDAFDSDDDVGLVVKTTMYDQQALARVRRGEDAETRAWLAFAPLLAGRRRVPEIRLISGELPAAGIDALHARGDCFLSLTRSEGWGLCIADAVLFGNPVVVTGWGGHIDYLGADYQLLVDYDLVPTTSEPVDDWFIGRPGDRWARARHDHAVERLRWVAQHREQAVDAIAPIRERLARECAPAVIGRRLRDVL